jgi:hypothetical protein
LAVRHSRLLLHHAVLVDAIKALLAHAAHLQKQENMLYNHPRKYVLFNKILAGLFEYLIVTEIVALVVLLLLETDDSD